MTTNLHSREKDKRSNLVNAIVRSFFENHLFRLAQYRREKKSLFNNYNPESHA